MVIVENVHTNKKIYTAAHSQAQKSKEVTLKFPGEMYDSRPMQNQIFYFCKLLIHIYNKAESGFGLQVRAAKPSEKQVVH